MKSIHPGVTGRALDVSELPGLTERALDISELDLNIDPIAVYRVKEWGYRLFGYKPAQLYDHIQNGNIPTPFPLIASETAGHVIRAWTGQQIIDHHRKRIAAAKRLLARAKEASPAAKRLSKEKEEDRCRVSAPDPE